MPRRADRLARWLVVLGFAMLGVACGGGPAPSTPGVAGPASASVAPTASPTPTPAPTLNSDDVLEAFADFVASEDAFHVVAMARMEIAGQSLNLDMAVDVAGQDQQGTVDFVIANQSFRTEIVVVDGVQYARVGGGAWQVVPGEPVSNDPLGGLAPDGLRDLGISNLGGVRVHHFQTDDLTMISGAAVAPGAEITISDALFDVYVTDDGRPLSATLVMDGEATIAGTTGPMSADIRYDFSRFGEPIEIVAPV